MYRKFIELEEIKEELNSLTIVGSVGYDDMPRSSEIGDRTASKAIRKAYLHDRVRTLSERILSDSEKLTQIERTVWLGLYRDYRSMHELAVELNYSMDNIYKISNRVKNKLK